MQRSNLYVPAKKKKTKRFTIGANRRRFGPILASIPHRSASEIVFLGKRVFPLLLPWPWYPQQFYYFFAFLMTCVVRTMTPSVCNMCIFFFCYELERSGYRDYETHRREKWFRQKKNKKIRFNIAWLEAKQKINESEIIENYTKAAVLFSPPNLLYKNPHVAYLPSPK